MTNGLAREFINLGWLALSSGAVVVSMPRIVHEEASTERTYGTRSMSILWGRCTQEGYRYYQLVERHARVVHPQLCRSRLWGWLK
jgi:hypothetical protein